MSEEFSGYFDLGEVMKSFPQEASTMLLDHYLADSESRSVRLFRVYRPVPAHFHRHCDEVLFVLSGCGKFWMEDAKNAMEFKAGSLIIFPRLKVHSISEILEPEIIFLAIDTPRRAADDVVFVDQNSGTAQDFIEQISGVMPENLPVCEDVKKIARAEKISLSLDKDSAKILVKKQRKKTKEKRR